MVRVDVLRERGVHSHVLPDRRCGTGGMALGGRCGKDGTRGEGSHGPCVHGSWVDPGDVSHNVGCLVKRAVSVGRGIVVSGTCMSESRGE